MIYILFSYHPGGSNTEYIKYKFKKFQLYINRIIYKTFHNQIKYVVENLPQIGSIPNEVTPLIWFHLNYLIEYNFQQYNN